MADLRAYLGSKCPSCKLDILQQEPSTNRMPGPARAWCPSCGARMTAEQLSARPRNGGLLKRLFSRPQHG